jgi:hypothetical protein
VNDTAAEDAGHVDGAQFNVVRVQLEQGGAVVVGKAASGQALHDAQGNTPASRSRQSVKHVLP